MESQLSNEPSSKEVEAAEHIVHESSASSRKTSKIIALLLLAVAVFAGGAFFAFKELDKKDAQKQQANESSVTDQVSANRIDSYIDTNNILKDSFSYEFNDDVGEGTVLFVDDTNRIIPVSTTDSVYLDVTVVDEKPHTSDEVKSLFVNKLIKDGFSVHQEPSAEFNEIETSASIVRYKKDTIVCTLSVSGYDQVHYVYRNCADSSQLPAASAALAPFYTAYEQGADFQSWKEEIGKWPFDYYVSVDESKKKESEFAGYEYVYGGAGSVQGGGARVAFYRKDAGEWQFAYGTQALLSCEDTYITDDMRKALAHDSCSSNATPDQVTTVKEHFKL